MFLFLYVSMTGALESAATKAADRLGGRNRESGQGALEYVGMLLLVAGVIALLVTTNIGGELVTQVKKAISTAFGDDSGGGGGGGGGGAGG